MVGRLGGIRVQHVTCVFSFHVRLVGPIDEVLAAGSVRTVRLPIFEEGINSSAFVQQKRDP